MLSTSSAFEPLAQLSRFRRPWPAFGIRRGAPEPGAAGFRGVRRYRWRGVRR